MEKMFVRSCQSLGQLINDALEIFLRGQEALFQDMKNQRDPQKSSVGFRIQRILKVSFHFGLASSSLDNSCNLGLYD
jgi:hypothetical protein